MLDSNKYDEQLLKKINYMIHLLEEQKKEKTDNVTEEFILYSFLGIFIIYIVDTFTRSGKYTR
jgi:high-affinity K+ transport system ATPase subunit B